MCIQLWYSEEACILNCDGLTYLLFSEIFLQLLSDIYGPFQWSGTFSVPGKQECFGFSLEQCGFCLVYSVQYESFFHQMGKEISGKAINKTATRTLWQNDQIFLDLCFLDQKEKTWCCTYVLPLTAFFCSLDQKNVFCQVSVFGNCFKMKLFYQILCTTAPRQEIPTWKNFI